MKQRKVYTEEDVNLKTKAGWNEMVLNNSNSVHMMSRGLLMIVGSGFLSLPFSLKSKKLDDKIMNQCRIVDCLLAEVLDKNDRLDALLKREDLSNDVESICKLWVAKASGGLYALIEMMMDTLDSDNDKEEIKKRTLYINHVCAKGITALHHSDVNLDVTNEVVH